MNPSGSVALLPPWLITTTIAAIGLCLGSFINVVITRLPAGESVVRPRSRCPRCKRQIPWFDNIPLFSFVLLRGKCRGCKTTISARYPLIELMMGALALALYWRLGPSVDFLLWLPLGAAFLAIIYLDLDHYWIPDIITMPMIIAVILVRIVGRGHGASHLALGLLPAAMIFVVGWAFLKLTGKEGLGFGDVKLLAVIGLALGPLRGLNALLLAAMQGAVIGAAQNTINDRNTKTTEDAARPDPNDDDGDNWQPPPKAIPFGPFLVLGALETLLLPGIFANVAGRLAGRLTGLF